MLHSLSSDVRFALRRARRAPAFTAAAVAILALGLGVNAALFELVYGALVAPLPYPEPERLVSIWEGNPGRGMLRFGVSAVTVRETAERPELDALVAWNASGANLWDGQRASRVEVVSMAGDLPAVLGAAPALGRWLVEEDAHAGAAGPIVLSHAFWRATLGADPGILEREIRLDGVARQVAGVLPPQVAAPFEGVDVFLPLSLVEDEDRRGVRWLAALGRVAQGASAAGLEAALAVHASRLAEEYPETNAGWTFEVTPLGEALAADARPALLGAWAAAGLVLLIACANAAQLLLARGLERRGEMAVRAALGAGGGRLARLVLAESLLLSCLGTALGLLAAAALRPVLASVAGDALAASPAPLPLAPALGWAGAATLATGLLAGLLPARGAARAALSDALRGAAPGAVGGRGRGRAALVIGQVALAVALVAGAALLLRSSRALLDLHPGFEVADRVVLRVAPPMLRLEPGEPIESYLERRGDDQRRAALFYSRLREELGALPGVRAVGASNRLPLAGRWWANSVRVEGPEPSPGEAPAAWERAVTPGFFEALGIPLRSGRRFEARDTGEAPAVVVVDEELARRLWPGEDAVGQRLQRDGPLGPWAEVVGVVGNVRLSRLDEHPEPFYYVPQAQALSGFHRDWGADVVVHAEGDLAALVPALRERIRALQADLPVFDVRTLEAHVASRLGRRRAVQRLLAAAALLALGLAAAGLSAALAYAVKQRRREIGVRLALGAAPARVARDVLWEAGGLAGAGGLFGIALAAALAPLLREMLYGVGPHDPASLAGGAASMVAVSLLAAWVPARRAARVDPGRALRQN